MIRARLFYNLIDTRYKWLTLHPIMNRCLLTVLVVLAVAVAGKAIERPTMGWSSWNTYRVNISDSLIRAQADALVALGLDKAGYRYINIDDGYFGGRDPQSGRLLFHPQRFPQGLKPVVDHIHRLGLKAGIYSDAGRNTCGNFWDHDTIARGVGLYGHEPADSRHLFGELGFDFIKVDFCGGDPKQNSEHLELDPAVQYAAIRRAIDASGRKDVRMNVCRWDYPGTWVSDVASSWRISHDITPSWQSVRNIIAENLYLSAYAGGGHYNDMDMLELGRGLTPAEERTHFAMWCIMSSPLLIGCDMTTMPEDTRRLLANSRLIAINQDPLGLQAYVAQKSPNGGYVLVKDIIKLNGTRRAVALYNPTDSTITVSAPLKALDLEGNATATDLFSGAESVITDGHITATLEPHATAAYSVKADRRLMRTLYEAETAYLSEYQEIENKDNARYKADSRCSGGMMGTGAGNSETNDIVWRDVYVPATGTYLVTIRYMAPTQATMQLKASGEKEAHTLTAAASSSPILTEPVKVKLRKGRNSIRLYAPAGPMPDIDCMHITR